MDTQLKDWFLQVAEMIASDGSENMPDDYIRDALGVGVDLITQDQLPFFREKAEIIIQLLAGQYNDVAFDLLNLAVLAKGKGMEANTPLVPQVPPMPNYPQQPAPAQPQYQQPMPDPTHTAPPKRQSARPAGPPSSTQQQSAPPQGQPSQNPSGDKKSRRRGRNA